MSLRRIRLLALLLSGLTAPGLSAQVPLFVSGAGGLSIDVGDDNRASGAGVGWQGQVGVRLKGAEFGGEIADHRLGDDRKARVYGGFLRIPAGELASFRPYIVLAVGAYRFSPAPTGNATHLGGSGGPGARFLLGNHAAFLIEARFHTTFSKVPSVTTQDFVAILAGVDLTF